jgi:hypothetical protein
MNPAYFDSEGKKRQGKVRDMPEAQRKMWKQGYVQRKVFGTKGGTNSRAQMIKQAAALIKQETGQAKLTKDQTRELFGMSQRALSEIVSGQRDVLTLEPGRSPAPRGQQSMPGMGGGDADIVREYKRISPKGRAKTINGMKKAIAQYKKKQQAASNPAYWPRYAEYHQVEGPYGAHRSAPIPVNRRNPAGKTITARWPGTCSVTGNPYKRGDLIADSGRRGPKGGKKMMLVKSM